MSHLACMKTLGRLLPEKLGGVVLPSSQNPCPIYDQNLWFSPTLFMTLPKIIQHPIYDCCLKHNLWTSRAFGDGLVDNDKNVASKIT